MAYTLSPSISKYKISRRGRKLQISDDSRTLVALPRDVPERTWAEILQKEENDLVVLDIREEIVEAALQEGYERYMERQVSPFTVNCAAIAWLKLIDWHFYRHDPGEEPSSYPPCYIPKREESWLSDQPPEPSPKDSWCRHELSVVEDSADEGIPHVASSSSLDYPVVEDIPREYWFPGKVLFQYSDTQLSGSIPSDVKDQFIDSFDSELHPADSELLQKVTDYSTDLSRRESQYSALKTTTPVEGSLQGAGDSTLVRTRGKKADKGRMLARASVCVRSRGQLLPPLASRSRVSLISDCRLRNLRSVAGWSRVKKYRPLTPLSLTQHISK